MKKNEIIAKLEELNIEFNARDKKEDLLELLLGISREDKVSEPISIKTTDTDIDAEKTEELIEEEKEDNLSILEDKVTKVGKNYKQIENISLNSYKLRDNSVYKGLNNALQANFEKFGED